MLKHMKILGIMSGTSVDGLDIALCKFNNFGEKFNYELIFAETIPYSLELKEKLINCMDISPSDLLKLDHQYGKWIGEKCKGFLNKHNESAELIASHGHTVFHNPAQGYSLQIGNGNDIAAISGIPVIYDFRSMDIALGGQGAPLVPIGDQLLFSDYPICLNLGGFSNISYQEAGKRIAFDICPVNIALNYLAEKMNLEFDKNGDVGRSGKLINELFEKLEKLEYYTTPPPKSLGKEWFNNNFKPLLNVNSEFPDIFHTVYQHIYRRISIILSNFPQQKVLVTGGGANNSFLMELLNEKSTYSLIVPDKMIIEFKEAIIFGFLGYLRFKGLTNTLKSVTGATHDSCGGIFVNI